MRTLATVASGSDGRAFGVGESHAHRGGRAPARFRAGGCSGAHPGVRAGPAHDRCAARRRSLAAAAVRLLPRRRACLRAPRQGALHPAAGCGRLLGEPAGIPRLTVPDPGGGTHAALPGPAEPRAGVPGVDGPGEVRAHPSGSGARAALVPGHGGRAAGAPGVRTRCGPPAAGAARGGRAGVARLPGDGVRPRCPHLREAGVRDGPLHPCSGRTSGRPDLADAPLGEAGVVTRCPPTRAHRPQRRGRG